MDNIKLEMNNLTEEERKQLMALIEKANKPKRWKPKYGEKYWYISGEANAFETVWQEHRCDISAYTIHNCFRTESEARFKIEKLKVYNELLTYAEEHNEGGIDWGDAEREKVFLYYSHCTKTVNIRLMFDCENVMQVYFTSYGLAQAAVNEIGEERIKKYLFGVED